MSSERFFYAIFNAGNASHEQLLISHADPLPDGGLPVPTGLPGLTSHLSRFEAGAARSSCSGEQMSFSVSLKQTTGRLLRPKIAFQARRCAGCRFEDLSLKFFGVPLPVPLRFDASALGGTLPDELETGREYEMSCDFRDANVRLPLAGETPCCVNLLTKEMVAKVSFFKWLYFDMARDLGDDFFMNIHDDASGDMLLSWHLFVGAPAGRAIRAAARAHQAAGGSAARQHSRHGGGGNHTHAHNSQSPPPAPPPARPPRQPRRHHHAAHSAHAPHATHAHGGGSAGGGEEGGGGASVEQLAAAILPGLVGSLFSSATGFDHTQALRTEGGVEDPF